MAKIRIPDLSPQHRSMVKHFQPYHAGDEAARHPLSVLADLSNADKHRLINPTYGFMASDVTEAVKSIAANPDSGGGRFYSATSRYRADAAPAASAPLLSRSVSERAWRAKPSPTAKR